MKKTPSNIVVSKQVIVPFVLITALFALWGFANDITNPLVATFGRVMEISSSKAAFVQLAFYGGYFTMALPAAMFIKKYSYKTAILIGLGLYATGALQLAYRTKRCLWFSSNLVDQLHTVPLLPF